MSRRDNLHILNVCLCEMVGRLGKRPSFYYYRVACARNAGELVWAESSPRRIQSRLHICISPDQFFAHPPSRAWAAAGSIPNKSAAESTQQQILQSLANDNKPMPDSAHQNNNKYRAAFTHVSDASVVVCKYFGLAGVVVNESEHEVRGILIPVYCAL